MALYQTDFSGYTLGVQPSDWTKRWTTTDSNWTVESGPVLRNVATEVQRHLLTWDPVDSDPSSDYEVLARVRVNNATNGGWKLLARASGASGSEDGYFADVFNGSTLRIGKWVAGAFSSLASVSFSYSADTYYWMRFRVEGTALKVRIWTGRPEDEPEIWDINTTDSSLTTSGWAGMFGTTSNADFDVNIDFDYFAVATGGDSAAFDVEGAASINENDDAASASGEHVPDISGTANISEADDVSSVSGFVYPHGTGVVSEGDDSAAASGHFKERITAIIGDWATYTCTLEGSPDIVLPISSFQSRRRSGELTSLNVVVPSIDQSAEVVARQGDDLVLTMTIHYHDGTTVSDELVRATLEDITENEGGRSKSLTLIGRSTVTTSTPKVVYVSGVSYRRTDKGVRTLRCAINYGLRPGDTIEDHEGNRWPVEEIVYSVAASPGGIQATMEAKEAA